MTMNHTNPILLDIPESFETDRLLIRAPFFGDGAAVNEAIRESIDELRKWMPWAQKTPTVEETEINVRRARVAFLERSDMRLHLFLKSTGQFIGSSGLHRMDWQVRSFEIGYWVRTSCSGHGYITEAVEGITAFAVRHLNANRIEIRCDSRNTRSARVAERAHFTLEGILRNERLGIDGQLRHTMVFAKVSGIDF